MSISTRNLLEAEVVVLSEQLNSLHPGILDAKEFGKQVLQDLEDLELFALASELKDLLRALGGVRRR
jgi:hypothetical protein